MHTSEQINEIAAALAKAQAVIQNPAKDKINPHFKSSYADLASGLDVIRPALSAQAIAILQATEIVDDGVILRTRMVHSSGQWVESTYPVSKFAQHQAMGAALTYAKRQALFALVGVCGDDEQDGEDAKDAHPVPPRQTPRREPLREVPSEPPLSAPESKSVCESMLLALDMCETREHLHAWATSNSAAKQRLTSADQAILKGRFELKQKDIKNARAPMSEAAE